MANLSQPNPSTADEVNRNTVQRRTVLASKSLSDALLGEMDKHLGKIGPRPALLCVAVKRKLNGIEANRVSRA